MIKNYFSKFLFTFLLISTFTFGQVNLIVNTSVGNATTQARVPNGSSGHSFMRGSSLILASELTEIPLGTTLNSFGFVTTIGANIGVAGTINVYMINSADATFTRGLNWATIISGMTQVYTGSYTVPATATNIDLTLTTPFVYTGGSVYVAYDFVRTGTAATTAATYSANNTGLVNGCVSAASATVAPTTLAATSFRPIVRLGFPNPNSNDMAVEGISSLGNVATTLGLSVPISAVVRNKSNTTLNNIIVSAGITGSNTFNDSQNIATLAPGAATTVNFANWTPSGLGANVIQISVPTDQVNTNNTFNFNTATTCYTLGAAQSNSTYTNSIGFNTGGGIISTPIQNSVASTVSSVNIAISSGTTNVGNNVFGVLLDNTGTILAQSPNLTIANGDLNTIKTFTFPTPIALAANQLVHIGLGQTANATTGYFPIGSYNNANLSTVYNTSAITGGTLTVVATNLGQMGIEANYTGSCILSANSFSLSGVKIYPNPAKDVLNIQSENEELTKVSITDLNGRVVKEVNNNLSQISLRNLAKGIYMVTIESATAKKVEKLIVE